MMHISSTTQNSYTSITTTSNTAKTVSFADELTDILETVVITAEEKTDGETPEYKVWPGGNGFAYEGMFEEMIANFTAKHEDEFRQTYEFYDKYKDVFTPKYSNYTRQKADSIARELNAEFPEYKEVLYQAYHGGSEADKEKFNAMLPEYQAFNKYLHEKYDLDMGIGLSYSPEGARAYNFAVYEELENGKSIEEASKYADGIASAFGGQEGRTFQMMGLMGYPDSMEEAMQTPQSEKEIDYDTQIDLREYGIEHNFTYTNFDIIFGTDKEGIKRSIMYKLDLYGFLTTHEELVSQKVDELQERSPEWFEFAHNDDNYAENLKESFRENLKIAQLAQTIFEKYSDKIFQTKAGSNTSTEELLSVKTELSTPNHEQKNPLQTALEMKTA